MQAHLRALPARAIEQAEARDVAEPNSSDTDDSTLLFRSLVARISDDSGGGGGVVAVRAAEQASQLLSRRRSR